MYLIYNDKGDIVKVLSIREPYASLIKLKIKTIETRSFKTNYRGELYIHASLSKSNVGDELSKLVMPMYGKIICKCKLVDCVLMTENYVKEIKDIVQTSSYDQYLSYINILTKDKRESVKKLAMSLSKKLDAVRKKEERLKNMFIIEE